MNGFSLNGAGLNSSASTNRFAALPATTILHGLTLSERTLSFLPATTMIMEVDMAGSIIAISPFAPTEIGMNMDVGGVLLKFSPFPAHTIGMDVSMSGNPILTGGLSASIGMGIEIDGPLLRTSYFDPAQMSFSIETDGDLLRAIKYMNAAIAMGIDLDGVLVSFSPMAPTTIAMAMNMQGSISVNATEQDADERTMVRPYQERTMVRQ